MVAILRNTTVIVVVVVRTSPRAILLAMITTRKSIHWYPLASHMGMELRLAALWAAGARLKMFTHLLLVNYGLSAVLKNSSSLLVNSCR